MVGCSFDRGISPSTCSDGWTTTAAGQSVVIKPGPEDRGAMEASLPPDQEIVCIHRLPDGKVVVIAKAKDGYRVHELSESSTGYVVTDSGFLVMQD